MGMNVVRGLWAVLAAAVLAGCQPGGAPPSAGPAAASGARSAPVLGGALALTPPRGYCIDRGASHDDGETAVLILGRCSDDAPAEPAVLTVSVGDAGSASAMAAGTAPLVDWFTSPEGRKLLSRSGNGRALRIVEVLQPERGPGAGALLMHMTEPGTGDHWRGLASRAGRLVTVTVMPPDTAPLPADVGRTLLERSLAGLVVRTPLPASAPPVAPGAPLPEAAASEKPVIAASTRGRVPPLSPSDRTLR